MEPTAAAAPVPFYPVTVGLNAPLEIARWRVIGNWIMAIPHFIVLYVLQIAANVATFIAWFAILFTGRMPEGLGTFIAGVHRYQWRVISFAMFLREPYPAFGVPSGYADPGDDPAWVQIMPATSYNRLAVFFRLILAIPLFLYGFVLALAEYVVLVIAFFGVLFTGRWPEGMHNFVMKVSFWWVRVNAWYSLLADPYPPFVVG